MGEISKKLGGMIIESFKAKDIVRRTAYTNLKSEILKFKTSVEGAKLIKETDGELTDQQEITIVKKMVKELKGDIDVYSANGREDIAKEREIEMNILSELLPKEASAEDIEAVVSLYVDEHSPFTKKEMGACIKHVKSIFDNVDGKLVSQIVMAFL